MPTYDAQCNQCDVQFEFRSSIERCMDVPPCPLCNSTARRIIAHAPMGFVKGKFDPYMSPVDGSVISTAHDLAEHNKRNSVVQIQEGFDEAKVLKGDFAAPKAEVDKEEVAQIVQEAIHDVSQGYKPTLEVQNEDGY